MFGFDGLVAAAAAAGKERRKIEREQIKAGIQNANTAADAQMYGDDVRANAGNYQAEMANKVAMGNLGVNQGELALRQRERKDSLFDRMALGKGLFGDDFASQYSNYFGLPMLAKGAKDFEGEAIVGENGPEIIKTKPSGKVDVIPLEPPKRQPLQGGTFALRNTPQKLTPPGIDKAALFNAMSADQQASLLGPDTQQSMAMYKKMSANKANPYGLPTPSNRTIEPEALAKLNAPDAPTNPFADLSNREKIALMFGGPAGANAVLSNYRQGRDAAIKAQGDGVKNAQSIQKNRQAAFKSNLDLAKAIYGDDLATAFVKSVGRGDKLLKDRGFPVRAADMDADQFNALMQLFAPEYQAVKNSNTPWYSSDADPITTEQLDNIWTRMLSKKANPAVQ